MNTNLDSPTKLTEFAPLSPEEKRAGVGFIFTRFFKRGGSSRDPSPVPLGGSENSSGQATPVGERELGPTVIVGDDWRSRDDGSDHSSTRESTASLHPSSLPFPIYADVGDGRSLPNVLKRISNLLAMKSSGLQAYKDTDFKQYWMPDSVSKECYDCGDRFTTFRRRHHCRVCGQIFCSRCCNQEIPGKIMGCTGDLRVCTYCCKVVLSYLQSADIGADLSADLRAVQEDLQSKFGETTVASMATMYSSGTSLGLPVTNPMQSPIDVGRERSIGSTRTIGRRKQSYQEDRFALGRGGNLASPSSYLASEELQLSAEERWQALQGSSSLRALWEEIRRMDSGVPLQSHRYRLRSFPACFVGTELVDWLLAHNRAATMVQAVALGQALIDGGYLECISHIEPIFQDGYALYRLRSQPATSRELPSPPSSPSAALIQPDSLWTKQMEHTDSANTDSESEMAQASSPVKDQDSVSIPSSSSTFYLDLDVQENRVQLRRPKQEASHSTHTEPSTPQQHPLQQTPTGDSGVVITSHDLSSTGISREFLTDTLLVEGSENRELVPSMGWHRVQHLRTDNGEREAYTRLSAAFEQHEQCLLQQLLSAEGLAQSWGETVTPLVHQVVDLVRPDVRNEADDMDLRQYVQFKKVCGGTRSECCVVSGVVCTKNVAHRSMAARLTNPRILLLGCSIIYERVEGRFLSLEPLIMQEQDYLKNVVARIVSLQPELVLVERTVSRLAQDLLLEQGITLVLNVKATVLERVARSTQADIVTCIDAHVGKPRIGMCHNFYTKAFQLDVDTPNKCKTLMFFDGCATHLGCTAILRGGTSDELRRLKRVISHLILVNYSWRHEKSFLMDEFAMPPSAPADTFFADEDSIIKDDKEIILENTQNISKDDNDISKTTFLSKPKECCDKDHTTEKLIGDQKVKIRSRAPSREKGSCSGEDKKIEAVVDQSDPLHQYLVSGGCSHNAGEDTEVFSPSAGSQLSVATLPLTNRFRKALDDTVLSSSPYLQFSVPFLETEAGRQCALRRFFPEQVFWSPQLAAVASDTQQEVALLSSTKNDDFLQNGADSIFVREYHPFVHARLSKCAESWEVQALLASFRAGGGRLQHPEHEAVQATTVVHTEAGREQGRDSKATPLGDAAQPHWPQPTFIDALNPMNHQRLAVLFCSFSHESNNAPAFCVNPWVVHMELYGRNDIPLGQFLDHYCFRKSYACPSPTCTTPMLHHIRRFVHDAGCVQVTLKELDSQIPVEGNAILMWSWCLICKLVSPVVPMSVDTWSLSFAKYLELRFHGNMHSRRGKEKTCPHSLHHDHYQYFGYRDVVASFKYTTVALWEISLPPPAIEARSAGSQLQVQAAAIEEVKQLAWKGYEVFSAVLEKLCLGNESETSTSKLEGISNLKNQLKREHASFKSKIEEVQLRLTSPTLEGWRLAGCGGESGAHPSPADNGVAVGERLWDIEDCLVQLKRMIAEAVTAWNTRIADMNKKKDDKFSRKSGDVSKLMHNLIVDGYCGVEEMGNDSATLTLSSDSNAVECSEASPSLLAAASSEHTASGEGLSLVEPSLTSSSETSHTELWYAGSDKKNSSSLDVEGSGSGVLHECSSFSSPTIEGLEAGLGMHQAWADQNHYVLIHHNEVPEETAQAEVVKGHERSHSEGDSRSASVGPDDTVDGGSRTERRSVPQVPPAATVKQIISQLLPSTPSTSGIPCPLSQQEHHLLPPTLGPALVVYESEPSSIIAYALSSVEYQRKLYDNRQPSNIDGPPPPSPIELKRKFQQDVTSSDLMASIDSTGSARRTVLSFLRGGSPNLSANRGTSTPRHSAGEYDGVQYTAAAGSIEDEQPADSSTSMAEPRTKATNKSASLTFNQGSSEPNIDVHFSDATTAFHCRVYLPEQFVALRALVCPEGEESYARSLSRCVQWAARGGKSGSAFCKTRDDRFVLKEMTQHEVQLFLEIAPNYLGYIRRAIEGRQPTLLGKIVGVYRVGFRSTAGTSGTGNSAMKSNLLVMENLFYGRTITQRFDLKGSVRNRLVEPTLSPQGGEIVLLDENLLKMTCDAPLYIQPHSKLVLTLAIEKDTQLLSSQAVMDYSLLVGLDEERRELVIGIIDYIRTFTWDKKLETMVKSSGILGGQGKLPTVVSPELYQSRFMAAMHRYFLPVPDRWTGLGRGVDC